MYFWSWLIGFFQHLWSFIFGVLSWIVNFFTALFQWMMTGSTAGFASVFGQFSSFSDAIWNVIQRFNIFGDFGVGILYNWIPEGAVTGALTYMFTFLCLIGSLKLLKKILPFW